MLTLKFKEQIKTKRGGSRGPRNPEVDLIVNPASAAFKFSPDCLEKTGLIPDETEILVNYGSNGAYGYNEEGERVDLSGKAFIIQLNSTLNHPRGYKINKTGQARIPAQGFELGKELGVDELPTEVVDRDRDGNPKYDNLGNILFVEENKMGIMHFKVDETPIDISEMVKELLVSEGIVSENLLVSDIYAFVINLEDVRKASKERMKNSDVEYMQSLGYNINHGGVIVGENGHVDVDDDDDDFFEEEDEN